MKRLTPSRRRWLIWRHAKAQKKIPRRRIAAGSVKVILPDGSSFAGKAGWKRAMPAVMCFDDNSCETVATLASIRNSLSVTTKGARAPKIKRREASSNWTVGTYRAFENVKKVTPAAALVLAAEYDRWKLLKNFRMPLFNLQAWDPTVLELLREIGFLSLFEYQLSENYQIAKDEQRAVLQMRSGQLHSPGDVNDLVTDLRQLYPQAGDDVEERMLQLYEALTEAVVNVIHHAYPHSGGYAQPSVKRWWMTGAVDRKAGQTSAAVYDQGVTIPGSLPEWEKYAGVTRRILTEVGQTFGLNEGFRDPKWDGQVIAAAVAESVSSTGQPGRGLGLAQMRSFVDACRGGYLRIISRRGEVVFRPNHKPVIIRHAAALGGTLVEWNVLL